jgi:hypothetical protein
MKAVVVHGVGDIRLDDVPEPAFQRCVDAIVRLTENLPLDRREPGRLEVALDPTPARR